MNVLHIWKPVQEIIDPDGMEEEEEEGEPATKRPKVA